MKFLVIIHVFKEGNERPEVVERTGCVKYDHDVEAAVRALVKKEEKYPGSHAETHQVVILPDK